MNIFAEIEQLGFYCEEIKCLIKPKTKQSLKECLITINNSLLPTNYKKELSRIANKEFLKFQTKRFI